MLGELFHIVLAAVVIANLVEKIDAVNWDFVQSTIKYILSKNFTTEGPVLLLMSNAVEEDFPRSLDGQNSPRTLRWLEDMTLKFVCEHALWPVIVFQPENNEASFDEIPEVRNNGYIIFVNPQTEEFEDVLDDSISTLQFKSSWNSRSKFLIVAYGQLSVSPASFAETVLLNLKSHDNITNSLLLIINADIEKNSSVVVNEIGESASSSDNIISLYA